MQTRRHNDEVFYPDERVVRVTRADVEQWKIGALASPRQRIRFCAHQSTSDLLHEMLVVHTSQTYVRPHKHVAKSESFHVMEGQADVVLFYEDGRIAEVIAIGEYASASCFYYRLAEPLYHGLVVRSATLVFHESTNGPFDRSQTIFAPWSPANDDQPAVDSFRSRLIQDIAAYRSRRP